MAGGEDSSNHEGGKSTTANSIPTPTPKPAEQNGGIPLHKTGEIMLGFALFIIFVVIFCIIAHLLLKQHRQRYPNGRRKTKKKKKKDLEAGTVELHSVEKKVFEAAGTEVVLAELPEAAPPRHEMDAGFVFPFSPIERTMTGNTGVTGTTAADMEISPAVVSPLEPWPDQPLAVYWQTR